MAELVRVLERHQNCQCSQQQLLKLPASTVIDDCPICSENGVQCRLGSHPPTESANSLENRFSEAAKDPVIASMRPGEGYERIDRILLTMPHLITDHAIHDSLAGEQKIAVYEIYKNILSEELLCVIKFGSSVNGHPGIVHGGITALLFDNSFGWSFFAKKIKPGFTANLNVNYRKPVLADTYALLRAKFERVDGRKSYLSAVLETNEGVVLADATSLFIAMKPNPEPGTN